MVTSQGQQQPRQEEEEMVRSRLTRRPIAARLTNRPVMTVIRDVREVRLYVGCFFFYIVDFFLLSDIIM